MSPGMPRVAESFGIVVNMYTNDHVPPHETLEIYAGALPAPQMLEQRSDHRVSMVRRVVEGLGGHLEVVAMVGDKRVKLVV